MWGSLLLASGVGIAIEGCANTYIRTGRLFPGPHLYAGAFIVALWALAAALVPAMQKGDNNARNAHIALNTVQVLLLLSQVRRQATSQGVWQRTACAPRAERHVLCAMWLLLVACAGAHGPGDRRQGV